MSHTSELLDRLKLDLPCTCGADQRAPKCEPCNTAMMLRDCIEEHESVVRDLRAAPAEKRARPTGVIRGSTDWNQIGLMCSAGRRSLWWRCQRDPGERDEGEEGDWLAIEICAGREGDDFFLRVERGQPLFAELLDMCMTATFAAET